MKKNSHAALKSKLKKISYKDVNSYLSEISSKLRGMKHICELPYKNNCEHIECMLNNKLNVKLDWEAILLERNFKISKQSFLNHPFLKEMKSAIHLEFYNVDTSESKQAIAEILSIIGVEIYNRIKRKKDLMQIIRYSNKLNKEEFKTFLDKVNPSSIASKLNNVFDLKSRELILLFFLVKCPEFESISKRLSSIRNKQNNTTGNIACQESQNLFSQEFINAGNNFKDDLESVSCDSLSSYDSSF